MDKLEREKTAETGRTGKNREETGKREEIGRNRKKLEETE